MDGIHSQLGKLGPCVIETYGCNNIFYIGYGQNFTNRPVSFYHQMSHIIVAAFDNGEWSFSGHEPDLQHPNLRVQLGVSKQAQEWAIQAILGEPTLRNKLEKWRKATVKRLEKSVPRLKAEHEAASKRLDALKSVSF